jgi:glyceraldehyde 3-phosphate dehydrogenase
MDSNKEKELYAQKLNDYVNKEKAAIELISALGDLLYNRSVELVLFRHRLIDKGVSQLIDLHRYAKSVTFSPIDIQKTTAVAKELTKLDLAPSKLDIGLLASQYENEKNNYPSLKAFLEDKLKDFIGLEKINLKPRDVVLFGFGRIGRLAARELILQAGKGQQLRLRAVVVRKISEDELIKRAALLRNDSVHGKFPGTVEVDTENMAIIANGQVVHFIAAPTPEEADYTALGIENALLIDNTGAFTDKESLSRHLKAKGVSRVLLTAPGKEIPNIVYGINQNELDLENERIYSAASCTTNAISPILHVIENTLGVVKGHIETVHAYTNDQNLLDNMHKKPRRGRSAAVNMVITSTGAGKAVTKVIPTLKDKLTANAVRVPTPNGSLAILKLEVAKETSVEEVNEIIRKASLEGPLVNQIKYSVDPELVSSDIIGTPNCSIYDSVATIVSPNKKDIVLYVWYDNEYGYTRQVIRLAKYVSKVRRLVYY